MKRFNNLLTYILLLNLFLAGSCNQDNDEQFDLPPITQTGKNTFGCIIKGRVMLPRDGSGTFNMRDQALRFFGSTQPRNYNEIRVNDFASKYTTSITLHIENLDRVGEYLINESNCQKGVDSPIITNIYCRIYDYEENIYKNYCSYTNSGELYITYFEFDEFLSGEFSCNLKNVNDSNDEIEIKSGRFDLNLSTLDAAHFP